MNLTQEDFQQTVDSKKVDENRLSYSVESFSIIFIEILLMKQEMKTEQHWRHP